MKKPADDIPTLPVRCGSCKRLPRYWDWCEGGARITCDCGVCGPAVADASGFEDCVPAWNRMWEPRPIGEATKKLAGELAAIAGMYPDEARICFSVKTLDGKTVEHRDWIRIFVAKGFLRECGLEVEG